MANLPALLSMRRYLGTGGLYLGTGAFLGNRAFKRGMRRGVLVTKSVNALRKVTQSLTDAAGRTLQSIDGREGGKKVGTEHFAGG